MSIRVIQLLFVCASLAFTGCATLKQSSDLSCQHCGNQIQGKYVVYLDHSYHKTCFVQIAPKCTICRKVIDGHYYTDFWKNLYHPEHKGDYPPCSYCGRFISRNSTNGGFKTNDGRNICNICGKDMIRSVNQVNAIVKDVQDYLNQHGIDLNMTGVPVETVDNYTLSRLSGHRKVTKERGLARYDYKTVNGKIVEKKFHIYILNELPRIVFEGILAHEMMHVWMYQNSDKEHSKKLAEGSANYGSYLLYSRCDTDMADYLIESMFKDPNKYYGDGFRRIEQYVRERGIDALLHHLKTKSRIP